MKKLWILFLCLLFLSALPKFALAQANLSIANITDNRSSYPNSQIPKYEKFEITFNVGGGIANNSYFPYEANPPPGLAAGIGITVNLELTYDNWATVLIQPAFLYQNFDDQTKSGREWFYPNGNPVWKARFAPDRTGNWKYRIRATDASGSILSPEQNFTVSNSLNKGFIRISQTDKRYFEFEDGSLFAGLGYNMNFRQIDWINPVLSNQTNFTKMKENGIQFIRIWLSQWSLYGPLWSPWKDFNSQDGDPPATALTSLTGASDRSDYDVVLNSTQARSCLFYDVYQQGAIPLKRNTNYRLRALVYPDGLVGAGGFSFKMGDWSTGCSGASSVTSVVRSGANVSWQWIEGDFNSGTRDFIDHLYVHFDNLTGGSVRIAEVEVREVANGNLTGPNIIPKYKFDSYYFYNQRSAYAFDKLLDLAKQYDIYLRPVIFDHRDWIFNRINFSGVATQNAPCAPGETGPHCPSASYFYGPTDRSDSKVRWLQKAVLRYLHARYGYSSNIHSWEWVNEGTTGTEHPIAADIAGRYFDSFNTNRHLVATSSWDQQRSTAAWWGGLNNYSGIDFADIHRYVDSSNPSQFYDLAQMAISGSNFHGASNQSVNGRFPVVGGESGIHDGNYAPAAQIVSTYNAHKGVWLHNFLWATLNSNAMYDPGWWWPQQHIYPGSYDIRPLFKHYYDFLNNIPLNKGGYVDIAASGFDTNLVRVVGQKNTATNKAHFWVQNKRHTWCAVAGGISGCPTSWDGSRLSGTITFFGFTPNQTLPVEYWYFDNSVVLTKQTGTISTGNGTISINLSNFPATVVDAGIKIGDYTQSTVTPTPTVTTTPGDANGDGNVDGVDYVIWINHYNTNSSGPSSGDFNNSGRVDGADYVIWLNNYNS